LNVLRTAVRSVPLTSRLVAQHAPNRPLCLAPMALGGGVSLAAEDPGTKPDGAGDVAIVAILGPLAQRAQIGLCDAYLDGYDAITARVSAALETVGVSAVLLVIDSPGGDVAGLEEAITRIKTKREAPAIRKPIFAYVDELCASAAYWLASGICDGGIFVPPSGAVGSIGAMAVHVDESGALAQAGIKPTIIASPAGKAATNGYEPLSKTGRARIQELVSATSDRFVAAVAKARDLKPAAVAALNADMRTGADAVRAGLADGVAALEQVLERAQRRERTTRAGLAAPQPGQKETNMSKQSKAAARGMTVAQFEQHKAQKRAAKAGASVLTEADRDVAALLGLDDGQVAATKAEMARQHVAGVPVGVFYPSGHLPR
jgi:ClpP class serine protease